MANFIIFSLTNVNTNKFLIIIEKTNRNWLVSTRYKPAYDESWWLPE